jgi:hypothetical protein
MGSATAKPTFTVDRIGEKAATHHHQRNSCRLTYFVLNHGGDNCATGRVKPLSEIANCAVRNAHQYR